MVEDENVSTTAPVPSVPVPTLGRTPVPHVPVFNLGRVRLVSEPATLRSSIPGSEGDSILADSPKRSSKTLTNRAASEADSVNHAIGSKFKQMGNDPTFGDAQDAFPPLPSQKLMD